MDDPAFDTSSNDTNTQTILLCASQHNLTSLKPFLRIPGNASVQDLETGFTPLHAAIAACEESPTPEDLQKATDIVKQLFLSGAIWNDLDNNGETPGCLAWRIGRKELYELCVEAGVRAELLLGILDGKSGYEELDSDDELEKIDDEDTNGHDRDVEISVEEEKKDVNSADYLASDLKFEDDKLLDADDNGVMMAWEADIMRQTVDLLLPRPDQSGKRILNIGFGMGIIDQMFAATKPYTHHIVEAHPHVLAKIATDGSGFGQAWERGAPAGGNYEVHKGRWQEVLPGLLEKGEVFDAIYFDTFGEDYTALKVFFTDFVPGLLDEQGRFGFFNGLGADRRVCYDVYQKVSEFDLNDAGMDVEWTDVPVEVLSGDGEGRWKGVRRRYWTLDMYRLPICTFMK